MTEVEDVSQILPVGKVPSDLLRLMLSKYAAGDARIVLRPGIGVDATVVAFEDQLLVLKADPITFATDEIGWYAVNVSANDIAVVGGSPAWFLAVLLLPEGRSTAALVDAIFRQIHEACLAIGTELIGGHTEITYGLERPIVAGFMVGVVSPQHLAHPGLIEAGDDIVVARGVAIEATALMARERFDEVAARLGQDFARRCQDFLHNPGISVVSAARVAQSTGCVHAMHDPTEGGVATGLWEMAEAANLGFHVDLDKIPVFPETLSLCQLFGLDPLGVIASGSLIIAAQAGSGSVVASTLQEHDIPATVIGHFTRTTSKVAYRGGTPTELLPSQRDEITKLFEGT